MAEHFQALCTTWNVAGELRRIDSDQPTQEAILNALHSDLVIVGHPEPNGAAPIARRCRHQALPRVGGLWTDPRLAWRPPVRRLRELLLGGTTRTLLAQMPVPVLVFDWGGSDVHFGTGHLEPHGRSLHRTDGDGSSRIRSARGGAMFASRRILPSRPKLVPGNAPDDP